jgi:SAM-dependent MidA family methyltransferase
VRAVGEADVIPVMGAESPPVWRDWEQAWEQALYGPGGFVRSGQPPAAHFRTSVHVGGVLAEAVVELLGRVDTALDHPATVDLVDLGAGGGELLAGVVERLPTGLRSRVQPLAVDLRAAPDGWPLPWAAVLPDRVHGLVVAHEWLDALACPVVLEVAGVLRRVQVSTGGPQRDGAERAGPAADGAVRAWWRRWGGGGDRGEVGLPRDRAWAALLSHVVAGAAVAVDYGVARPTDTLAAYRRGRQVPPVPDGSCDLTAHVHWPSVAARGGGLVTQAEALTRLGVSAGVPGPDGWGWLLHAERSGQLAELSDPSGLGGFGWLLAERGGARRLLG